MQSRLSASPTASRRTAPRSRTRRRVGVLLGATGLLAAQAVSVPALAADSTSFATGVTAPGSVIQLGNATAGYSTWVSDHLQGFCRINAGEITQSTCNTDVGSPGQASFHAASNTVFVPDNSSKSTGVRQLTYDPATQRISSTRPFGSGLDGNRPTATAIHGDTLFVGGLKSGTIRRIGLGNPLATARVVGETSDGDGVSSLAVHGDTLYIAEGEGVSTMNAATAATSSGTLVASLALNDHVVAPSALAADTEGLWVTEPDEVTGAGTLYRWKYTGAVSEFGDAGTFPSAVTVTQGPASRVLVADDPGDGDTIGQGKIYAFDPADGADEQLGTAPLPSSGSGGDPGGDPGSGPGDPGTEPVTDGTRVATTYSAGPSSPSGYLSLGGNTWVSDASLGVCRLTPAGAEACMKASVGTPGQASVVIDGATTYVVVPDSGPQGGAVRYVYDSASDTLGDAARLGDGLDEPMTSSVASSDGTVIVGGTKDGTLLRLRPGNPAARSTEAARVDGPVTGMARLGNDLLVIAGGQMRLVSGIDSCSRCSGGSTPIAATGAPSAVTAAGRVAFIATGSHVERFDTGPGGGADSNWVSSYSTSTGTAALGSVSALGLAPGGELLLGDGQRSYTAPTE